MIAATGRYLGQRSSMGCQRDLAKSGVFPRSSIVLWFLFDTGHKYRSRVFYIARGLRVMENAAT